MSATVRVLRLLWPEDQTEDKPKPELRKETRRRVLKERKSPSKVVAVIDCIVRDLSDAVPASSGKSARNPDTLNWC